MAAFAFFWTAATGLALGYIFVVEYALISTFMYFLGNPHGDLALVSIGYFFILLPITVFVIFKLQEYLDRRRSELPYVEPSLLHQYLSAKHRKICPLLEFTND